MDTNSLCFPVCVSKAFDTACLPVQAADNGDELMSRLLYMQYGDGLNYIYIYKQIWPAAFHICRSSKSLLMALMITIPGFIPPGIDFSRR